VSGEDVDEDGDHECRDTDEHEILLVLNYHPPNRCEPRRRSRHRGGEQEEQRCGSSRRR